MSLRGSTETISTQTPALFEEAVAKAAALLRAGELVALPTETVYGLAANALDSAAVTRIFEAKGRPAHNPIIVHVVGLEMARRCVAGWTEMATDLAGAFWPGPLTLVLPRSREIPEVVTAGGGTVGIRWPAHPFIQAVIRACGFPLAAPSANRSNEISPTNAGHVARSLGGRIRLIVDGGQSQVGIESTVVDLSVEPAQVLRPGMIHLESLLAATATAAGNRMIVAPGERVDAASTAGTVGTVGEPLRSPGMLTRHYAPKAKVLVMTWRDETELERQLRELGYREGGVYIIAHSRIPLRMGGLDRVSVIPHDAEAYARALYAEWHRCDEAGAECIVMEAVPRGEAWEGIADRLRRAAAGL